MKNLDLNAMGVVEMDAKDMKKVDGGAPGIKDLIWAFARDIIEGYGAAVVGAGRWSINNPNYTGGRSFNH